MLVTRMLGACKLSVICELMCQNDTHREARAFLLRNYGIEWKGTRT